MKRTFTRSLESLDPLFDFIGEFAARTHLDDGVIFAMTLAVEELFTNMVKYGGGGDDVSLDLDVRDDTLVVRLDHPGATPFDVSNAADADVDGSLSDRVPGGIGLHLVRRVMDTFDYDHRGGTAHITITKRLGGS